MWGIVLTNAAGDAIEHLVIDAPIESLRDWCRRTVESRSEAVRARLISKDGFLDYAYPEGEESV